MHLVPHLNTLHTPLHTNTTYTHSPRMHTRTHTTSSQQCPAFARAHRHTALGSGTTSMRTGPFQLCSPPRLMLPSTAHHYRKATWCAIPLQARDSPTRILSPLLPACHASPSLSPTEQLSYLKKLSLTHPTPSLPSSRHHLAILHFHRRNNLHFTLYGLYIF